MEPDDVGVRIAGRGRHEADGGPLDPGQPEHEIVERVVARAPKATASEGHDVPA
jgi:hypothetical protein